MVWARPVCGNVLRQAGRVLAMTRRVTLLDSCFKSFGHDVALIASAVRLGDLGSWRGRAWVTQFP